MSGDKFCKNCGEQLSADFKFCPNCGTKTNNKIVFERSWWEGLLDVLCFSIIIVTDIFKSK